MSKAKKDSRVILKKSGPGYDPGQFAKTLDLDKDFIALESELSASEFWARKLNSALGRPEDAPIDLGEIFTNLSKIYGFNPNEIRGLRMTELLVYLKHLRKDQSAEGRETQAVDATQEKVFGWKAIARAIGVSERAAKNYRKTGGLPVSKTKGQVWAYKLKLDKWLVDNSE